MRNIPNTNIIAIGKHVPKWVQLGIDEYTKRLPSKRIRWYTGDIKSAKNMGEKEIIKYENELLISKVPSNSVTIALDKKGHSMNNEQLCDLLQSCHNNTSVSFLIGGSLGLNQSTLDYCDHIWSLSNLILPHAMVRLILLEQLYRSWSILNHHPYHRE